LPNLAANPAFIDYALSLLVLSLNMLLLWVYSGLVRGKTMTTPNTEDASTVSKGAQLADRDPPEVARVLRAHQNAVANILPFALLGLVFVLLGGGGTAAAAIFGVFTFARVAHSLSYLGGRQPWRSIWFGVGGLTTLVLIGFIVRAIDAA
jgi:microsomal prostaglandin-E synthase 1